MFCGELLKMSIFCQLFGCRYSQLREGATAQHNAWQTEMKKMEIHTFSCVCVCVEKHGPKCVCECVHEFVYEYVCDVSVCHRVSSFPFTAPWQRCQTRPHMICVCLWEYVCVCVWVDSVFILLSNPSHLRSLGCSRVLPNGQSRPAKLAFGSGTELDA